MPKEQKFILPISQADEREELNFSALKNEERPEEEGQLCLDVAETADEIIVIAPMAGAAPEELELHLYNDLLTIRGERRAPVPFGADYQHQETFWGRFSRTIVLPADVRHELAAAEYKHGVLVVRLPKVNASQSIPITVVEE